MTRKKKRRTRAKPVEQYTHFVLRVDRYEVRAHAGINRHAHNPQYAWRDTEDEPLYEFEIDLEVGGACTHPESRAGDRCTLTIYCDNSPQSDIYRKLKDVQLVDDHYSRQYREYRGKRLPIYVPPRGMGTMDKSRGEAHWHGTIWAQPQFCTGLSILLGQGKPLFMEIVEQKIERQRWIQRVALQTSDPVNE
jgi:hypothetical protein